VVRNQLFTGSPNERACLFVACEYEYYVSDLGNTKRNESYIIKQKKVA